MRWTGFSGGPGYSIFHFNDFGSEADGWNPTLEDASNVATKIDTFAGAVLSTLPAGVTLQVMSDVEEINTGTGELVDIHSVPALTAKTAAHAASPYSAPTGAVITWRSARVHRGRRIRGRTFLVPLIGLAFENNGTLTAAAISTITGAATALMGNTATTGDLAIYARPTKGIGTDGAAGIVTGFSVPDMGAVLRSRR